MDDFEDENLRDSDFEVEFSDLPLDKEPAAIEKIALHALQSLSRNAGLSSRLITQATRFMHAARNWLLTEASSSRFADGSTKDDIELEVSDLSPTKYYNISHTFNNLNTRLALRMRFWRVILAVCTIALLLLLLFDAVPSVRTWAGNLLALPIATPTPAPSGSLIRIGRIIEVGPGANNAPSLRGTPLVGAPGFPGATPGSAPQEQDCPARPAMHGSNELGRAPVWVVGFAGLRATLHFAPDAVPVPAFPSGFGWTTSVIVEIPAGYKYAVNLYGENLNDGTSILFDYIPNTQGQADLITLSSQHPLVPPSNNGQRLSWDIELYFSSASCYYLKATWPGGYWIVYFSAGR